jgi:hypothetical protein
MVYMLLVTASSKLRKNSKIAVGQQAMLGNERVERKRGRNCWPVTAKTAPIKKDRALRYGFTEHKSTPRPPVIEEAETLAPCYSSRGFVYDGVVMILPQVHLRKPCYDFTFL